MSFDSRWWYGVLVAWLTASVAVVPVTAQEPETLPGQEAGARREFRADGPRLAGIVLLEVEVAEFDGRREAGRGFEAAVERVGEDEDTGQLGRVAGPAVGDETAAFAGSFSRDGFTVAVAVVVIRDDRFVHAWTASGLTDNPLPELLAVAERVIDGTGVEDDGEATPGTATREAKKLLRLLPGAGDLGPGYELVAESVGTEDEGAGEGNG